jgi:hypothetical protein
MNNANQLLYTLNVTWKQILARLVVVFVASASANIGIGAIIDISVVKGAALAGANAVLAVIHRLAIAYADGKLDPIEVKQVLDS